MIRRLLASPSAAAAAAVLAALAVVVGLHWPLLPNLLDHRAVNAFHDGHIWCFDHVYRMLVGQVPWSQTTERIGFPDSADLQLIGWAPALAAVPLRPLLGPVGAFNAVMLLAAPVAALATWALARRALGIRPWVAAGISLVYALCPYALGSMANGQAAKYHHWVLPVVLLAFAELAHGRRRWLGALGLVVATVACSFTSPSTALFVPLATGIWAIWAIATASEQRFRTALAAAAALALTAGALLPAWSYHGGGETTRGRTFAPGAHLEAGVIPEFDAPMAQPVDTFLGTGARATGSDVTNHVTYLGLPLLIGAGFLSLRRSRGRSLAWGLMLVGTAVAFGPRLVVGGEYVTVGDQQLALPAALLDAVGYPLAQGGMYYRAIVLASLGLALALATGLDRLRGAWAIPLAWIAGAVAVGDSIRSTSELWPIPCEPVAGVTALREMADDTTPGAVLDLPLETDSFSNGVHLVGAVFHGRPTTATPRNTSASADEHVRRVRFQLMDAFVHGDPARARADLAEDGYRYVVLRPMLRSLGMDNRDIARGLGPPDVDGMVRIWRLEPVTP